jgi:hypothetical protein
MLLASALIRKIIVTIAPYRIIATPISSSARETVSRKVLSAETL